MVHLQRHEKKKNDARIQIWLNVQPALLPPTGQTNNSTMKYIKKALTKESKNLKRQTEWSVSLPVAHKHE